MTEQEWIEISPKLKGTRQEKVGIFQAKIGELGKSATDETLQAILDADAKWRFGYDIYQKSLDKSSEGFKQLAAQVESIQVMQNQLQETVRQIGLPNDQWDKIYKSLPLEPSQKREAIRSALSSASKVSATDDELAALLGTEKLEREARAKTAKLQAAVHGTST